jgi:chromosome segregation ATPase
MLAPIAFARPSVRDAVHKTSIGNKLSEFDNPSGGSLTIQDIMHELKHAVETQAGTLRQLTDSHAELDEGETASEILKAVIEIISALARQCSDSDRVVHEKILALDGAIKFLVGRTESAEKRFAAIADLATSAKVAAVETQRLSSMVADISSQLHQLQAKVASWQAQSSNEALNNKWSIVTIADTAGGAWVH